ncbi:unnamed protein product [Gordionus sp. m RMFG-2023]
MLYLENFQEVHYEDIYIEDGNLEFCAKVIKEKSKETDDYLEHKINTIINLQCENPGKKNYYYHLENGGNIAPETAIDGLIPPKSESCITADPKKSIYHWIIHFGYDVNNKEVSIDINNVIIYQGELSNFVARASFSYKNWTLFDPICFDYIDYEGKYVEKMRF